jgi:hypothetical protein
MIMCPVRDCTANYRPVLSSERAPYMKKKESICLSKKFKIWLSTPKGNDTNTNWPADHRSQYGLNLTLKRHSSTCHSLYVCSHSGMARTLCSEEVTLSLCLTEHHVIKAYGGVDV